MNKESEKENGATYRQRHLIAVLTKDWSVMDREMSEGEAGTWIRRLQGKTCNAELHGRG